MAARVHDVLEASDDDFSALPSENRALLLKAPLVHSVERHAT
jgi:hypothetical protein